MDVNGTRYHLIQGTDDWHRCREDGEPVGPVVEACTATSIAADEWRRLCWDACKQWLTLKPIQAFFPRPHGVTLLDPLVRRGAAVDRFGNWFWIDHDRRRIMWHPSGSGRPSVWWSPGMGACVKAGGSFAPEPAPATVSVELAGLAITAGHYLVVGRTNDSGLYLFDLHAGGEPLFLLAPAGAPFVPFDLAAAPGGGFWVLDRVHRAYWGYDRHFQLLPEHVVGPVGAAMISPFHPEGEAAAVRRGPSSPNAFPVAAGDPIAIESLRDGRVLILDRVPLDGTLVGGSALLRYRRDALEAGFPLVAVGEDVGGGNDGPTLRPIGGHDFAYTPEDSVLTVAESDGNQAIAFDLNLDEGAPTARADYLPLHNFGGRGLVAWGGRVYSDVVGGAPERDTAVRWVKLHPIKEPRHARDGTLISPIFDGKERDCVWDRLYLDACLPPDTSVTVWTRATNDLMALEADEVPWVSEPPLYRRGTGSEVPYHDPFPELKGPRPDGLGTWEMLVQAARGRFGQVRLELRGNGRSTPRIRALRLYYPRFSYPRRYLPAIYAEDGSASLLERLLANPGGTFTDIEGRMAEVGTLFDARSAPPDALDWLANWVGLMLDPLWEQIQERRQAKRPPDGRGSVDTTRPADDRRRLFIRFTLPLYERRGTPEGLRLALHLLLDPCLEATLRRFKAASVRPQAGLERELTALELPQPQPSWSEEQFEELLRRYLLAPKRPSSVRVVERFRTRGGRAVVEGDPTGIVAATTHRFSVLIPQDLLPEEEEMVARVVVLEKPAHTAYDVRRFWADFRIGSARLALDTYLGEGGRFGAILLGRDTLASGYLSPAPPMDTPERLITDRDRLGMRPL